MKAEIEIQTLVTAILKKIRGRTSQPHLSAKLGLQHNHVYKWESGARKIQWQDFVKICEIKKIDLKKIVFDFYFYSGDLLSTSEMCKKIFLGLTPGTVSQMTGVSPFRVQSWIQGKGPFYLQDFLLILQKFFRYLPDFALHFLSEEELGKLNLDLQLYKMREFEIENPIFSIILRLLETKAHLSFSGSSVEYISQILKIDRKLVSKLLEEAADLNFISKKKDKFISKSPHINLKGKKAIEQRRFWIEKALEICKTNKVNPPDYVFGNLIYCISKEGQEKILDEYLNFFSNLRQIIKEDQGSDVPVVLNFQMFRMD